jgi:CubicO group peptidase (beta-lactamase class C family)
MVTACVRVLLASGVTLATIVAQPAGDAIGSRADALAQALLSRPVAGASVAVMRDSRIVFARGYGLANVEHAVPVTPDTVFHIASISKNILAAVVLRLVDERKIDLDADVTTYVPEAPTGGRRVTIRQLLNHTSGLFSFTSLPDANANERLDLGHDQVLALIEGKPFDFFPGTSWRYNNSAFYLAGMVVERVTKKEYGEYVRERLFAPLGMTSARMCDARSLVPHLAAGYDVERGALTPAAFITWKLPFAAGAICASATDLLRWQAALDSGRVIAPRSLALMRSPTRLTDGTSIDYGLGTRLGSVEGHAVVGHTGSGGGFAAALTAYPDDRLTVAVLLNTGVGANPALTLSANIARVALGLDATKAIDDLPVPPEEMAALPGRYDSDEGTVELFARDARLRFRLSGNEGVLRRQAPYDYAIDENIKVRFLTRNGRGTWSIVYTGGLLMDPKARIK